jgi:hypothetical protein
LIGVVVVSKAAVEVSVPPLFPTTLWAPTGVEPEVLDR